MRFKKPLVGLAVLALNLFGCIYRDNSRTSHLREAEEVEEIPADINDVLKDLKMSPSGQVEVAESFKLRFWNYLVELDNKKPEALPHFLALVVALSAEKMKLSEEQQKSVVALVTSTIRGELKNRGTFISWNQLATDLPPKFATKSADTKAFINELSQIAGSTLFSLPPSDRQILDKGRSAWDEREKLMLAAKKSIWIFSWAFYNDTNTGMFTADKLIEKKNAGVDVKIVVDGPVSEKKGYTEPLEKMENNGIPVIRWRHPQKFGYGMHRKVMIIDHEDSQDGVVIFGGKNFGDVYSHKKDPLPSNSTLAEIQHDQLERWRDTDMLVKGQLVSQAASIFATRWNQALDLQPSLNFQKISGVSNQNFNNPQTSGDLFTFVDQNPSEYDSKQEFKDPVYLATLKMIANATNEICISNAYFILTKPIQEQLIKAMANGVTVKIHTNSEESMDPEDKQLLGPIYRSLLQIASANPQKSQIYLQQSRTLHSKYLVIDKKFGWLGSYNIHPRSARYESESVGLFYGSAIGQDIHDMFERDTAADKSIRVTNLSDITPKTAQIFDIIEKFVFEQL